MEPPPRTQELQSSQLPIPTISPTPPAQPDSRPGSAQSQSFLFVSQDDQTLKPRKRKDWRVIRSHVMSHWHQQARDNSLSRLKEDIQRPGEERRLAEKSKPCHGAKLGENARTAPAIEGLCGRFEIRPKDRPTVKAKRKPISDPEAERGTRRESVLNEGSDEGYGTDQITPSGAFALPSVAASHQQSSRQDLDSLKSDETFTNRTVKLERFSGASKFDPFAATAVAMDRRAEEMIFHYSTTVLTALYPCKNPTARTQAYFQTILCDPMILCAKVAMAFTNSRFVSMSPSYANSELVDASYLQRGDTTLQNEWMRYKSRVMKMVNESLILDSDNVGNATLHTIITLAAISHFAGNAEETTIHMQAAIRIIKLRGGFQTVPGYILESLSLYVFRAESLLSWVSSLQDQVKSNVQDRVDLFLASGTSRPPLIPYLSITSILKHSASTPAGIAFDAAKPMVPKHFMLLLDHHLFNPTISPIAMDLYQLLALIDRFDDLPNISVEFWSQLPLQTFFVGYRLCAAVPSSPFGLLDPSFPCNKSCQKSPAPLQEAARLALLIFFHTTLVKSNPHLHMMHTLLRLLQHNLLATNINMSNPTPNTTILLWILFVGAHGSRGQVARPWFVRLIGRTAQEMGVNGWEDVKDRLSEFLWLKKELDVGWVKIWEEVNAPRFD